MVIYAELGQEEQQMFLTQKTKWYYNMRVQIACTWLCLEGDRDEATRKCKLRDVLNANSNFDENVAPFCRRRFWIMLLVQAQNQDGSYS